MDRHNIIASPTVVDVNVDYSKRITETSRKTKSRDEAVQEAKYQAITKHNIDILVDMVCKLEKKGSKYQATVTGYAGYYINSRTLKEDLKMIGEFNKEDIEKYLMMHNPEVIKYIYRNNESITINHNGETTKK